MPKCSFCGKSLPEGRGKMFVKNDGKIFYFCNSKCQRNWNMGRTGKHTKWTQKFEKA
ncbi:MAG: 50S ribosomal protein L24e [Candidatus Aenigmatarchaeota archaeon]|nr:MAG: 50S ribosomal protein L24e [Candidatus Aenigmarchaeota archaeon]RLJ06060.1 MAG: 50S ribosomal protein L24e [Candidatus Aenigmarchaeota archaeon]RLJ08155.1 MAG: 50S ribosomal protein L24e [Candidatus Aenigmarchaeota archaeon]